MRNNISKLILLGILGVNVPAFAVPEPHPIERPTPGPIERPTPGPDKTKDANNDVPKEVPNEQRPTPTPTETYHGQEPKGDVPNGGGPGVSDRHGANDGRGDKH